MEAMTSNGIPKNIAKGLLHDSLESMEKSLSDYSLKNLEITNIWGKINPDL